MQKYVELFSPTSWKDYELIDSGNLEKLERFGSQIIARPEPRALWDKNLSEQEWNKLANAVFVNSKPSQQQGSANAETERGEWKLKPGAKEQWVVEYSYKKMSFKMRLGLTAFKHVGIFPEQVPNWNFIYDRVSQMETDKPKVLNLFAYTGGASLAARAAGADVTHVDSIKQVITWSNKNMELSGLKNIKWVVEDAFKFVSREARRGNKYNGIVLDPPAYGRGPNGERWILEDAINSLLKECKEILLGKDSFLLLNMYSKGFSVLVADSLAKTIFSNRESFPGELYLPDKAGRGIPLGGFIRVI